MFEDTNCEDEIGYKPSNAEKNDLAKYIKDFLIYNASNDSKTVGSETVKQEGVECNSGEWTSSNGKSPSADASPRRTVTTKQSNPAVNTQWENDYIDSLYYNKYGSRPISKGRKTSFVFQGNEEDMDFIPYSPGTKQRWFQKKVLYPVKRNITPKQNNIRLKQSCDSREKKKKKASFDETIGSDSNLTGHDSNLTGHDSNLTGHDSNLTGHDSNLTGHDSNLTGLDSNLTGHDSKLTGHDSNLTGHDSKISGRNSYLTDHGSKSTGCDSKLTGHDSKISGPDSYLTGHGSKSTGLDPKLTGRDSNLIKVNASVNLDLKDNNTIASLNSCYVAMCTLKSIEKLVNVSGNSFNKDVSKTSVKEDDIHKCRDCVVCIERNSTLDTLMGLDQAQDIRVCDLCEPRRLFLSKIALRTHIFEHHIYSDFSKVFSVTDSSNKTFTTSRSLPVKSEKQNNSKVVHNYRRLRNRATFRNWKRL